MCERRMPGGRPQPDLSNHPSFLPPLSRSPKSAAMFVQLVYPNRVTLVLQLRSEPPASAVANRLEQTAFCLVITPCHDKPGDRLPQLANPNSHSLLNEEPPCRNACSANLLTWPLLPSTTLTFTKVCRHVHTLAGISKSHNPRPSAKEQTPTSTVANWPKPIAFCLVVSHTKITR